MFAPIDYLFVEWANIERTLNETLRHRFTERESADYHKECVSRLKYLKHLLDSLDASDLKGITALASKLHELSALIAYVERSHLEEFSWPFAYALRRTAQDICKEGPIGKLADIEAPLFFFTAAGGMCSYAVRPESLVAGLVGKKIVTVVFPRTLKDSVLLHAIIGHEIGHAAIATESVRPALVETVIKLIDKSVVEDPTQLFEWCKKHIGVKAQASDRYVISQALSWAEEFYCDIFGLISMGPCFLPAFQTLLAPLANFPVGQFVPSHPPYECRVIALAHAARALGMFYSENAGENDLGGVTKAIDKAFIDIAAPLMGGPFDILNAEQIKEATLELAKFSKSFGCLSYSNPQSSVISQLVDSLAKQIPPAGPYPGAKYLDVEKSAAEMLPCDRIDFRHILLAGWIRWSQCAKDDRTAFRRINSLCSHAILQQEGIAYWHEGKAQLMGTNS